MARRRRGSRGTIDVNTTTYSQVKNLAAELADRTRDNLPPSEATMLRAFFAAELPDLWNKEAWPELCDNIEAISLDANNCFDKRIGESNEMGEILAILDADPRTTTIVSSVTEYTELEDRVNVITSLQPIYVDWQDPAPDLLAVADDDLGAYTLPVRFRLPLAFRGAAHLIQTEDTARAAQYLALADLDLSRQCGRLAPRAWWRKGVLKR